MPDLDGGPAGAAMPAGVERLDRFMARANAAYYANHNPFADFTTAPEISQVFGELLGLWAATVWDGLGRPGNIVLAEAGPGRGTLMRDALRAVAMTAPEFAASLRVHLIEASARLRRLQAQAVPDAVFHEGLGTLPKAPFILLANEFLDALPIRQFVRRHGRWQERYVASGGMIDLPVSDDPGLPAAGHDEAVFEVSEQTRWFIGDVADRLAATAGAALFLDYGPTEPAAGDSLQAIREGRHADPFAEPGTADLTAHVDFAGLATVATTAGAVVHGPVPQGVFLARLGLFQRTDRLARGKPPGKAAALIAAARRLAEPEHMGRLFKALAVCHPGCPMPPGFAE